MKDIEVTKQKTRIHIDREEFESKNPTTGKALYKLADIPDNRELFKSVTGDSEDFLISRDDHEVVLHEDDHFYTQKEVPIIVNGKRKETVQYDLSFDELVKLAFENPPYGPNTLFTITYRNGPKKNPEGTLTAGHSVRIKKGMVFNVTATDKS
ncbi:multiubiquitin domain-containing protein [Bdellovibrio reynosensis]|uniref:Multiubiquitin domain-containing protein n=1 Tax=Bdellovibrio reynosensis TaxID=2835041 RepID=A0ABY4CD37_9BACT|nr:multiubiquitin domain-containing protein [Bdellovibrio reynosensis]UOF02886.1 multiubiquitin domain-containing protein [Bdellovibrio reynosensis]